MERRLGLGGSGAMEDSGERSPGSSSQRLVTSNATTSCHDRREKLARRALAVVESCWHRYSKSLRPAPTLSIHQNSPPKATTNRTVSPFENLAAAHFPLIAMS
jgi:hypothetical protein